jgi:nucleotide-binding universal stress UspA family protein
VRGAAHYRPRPAALGGRAPAVVCGVDDAGAEQAVVLFAADLSKRLGGRLILLQVRPAPLIELEPRIAYAAAQPKPSAARDQLAAARELARLAADAGVGPSTAVRVGYGDLEQQLLHTARDEQATVLVVGSRAGSRPGLGGSRAQRLIRRAACRVVVVPFAGAGRDAAPTRTVDPSSSILCGVDGSRHARLALRHAAQLAGMLDVRLVVAHVVQPPLSSPGVGPTSPRLLTIPIDAVLASGEALLETILEEEAIADATRRVVLGYPGDRLADLADEEAAGLVVVGSRGRGAVGAALLGSVSTDVIGFASCPVLVVPPRAADPGRERGAAPGRPRAGPLPALQEPSAMKPPTMVP